MFVYIFCVNYDFQDNVNELQCTQPQPVSEGKRHLAYVNYLISFPLFRPGMQCCHINYIYGMEIVEISECVYLKIIVEYL